MSRQERTTMRVALIHDVFHDERGPERLRRHLARAREEGAELAALPELPLNAWEPARREPRAEDAEAPGGPRELCLAEAARRSGLALLGGVIARDPESGRRFNRALLHDASGKLAATYDKVHIPFEEGFWEAAHYECGETPPQRVDGLTMPVGLQLCSDLFRPAGCHLLAAQGAEAIFGPRATPLASYPRWKLILQADAVTSAAYVLSTNRPRAESGVEIGGPSVVVAPDGEVLVESTAAVRVVTLESRRVREARREYPGYLPVPSKLYARAWQSVAE